MWIFYVFFNIRMEKFVIIVGNFIGEFIKFDDFDLLYFDRVMWLRVNIDVMEYI